MRLGAGHEEKKKKKSQEEQQKTPSIFQNIVLKIWISCNLEK